VGGLADAGVDLGRKVLVALQREVVLVEPDVEAAGEQPVGDAASSPRPRGMGMNATSSITTSAT